MSERKGFSEFVGRQADEIRRAWDALPSSSQSELGKALGLLPTDMKSWRGLIGEAMEHLRVAVGDKHQVVIVGPANSGKSTLYNTLIRSGKDRAEVSALPGTTRQAQAADAGLFSIVDTPGADTPGTVGEQERWRALAAAEAGDLLLVLFDAEHGIRPPEQALFNDLAGLGRPMVVALNKIDLVGRERAAVLGSAAAALGVDVSQLIPVSAKQGQGIDRLLVAVAKSEPGIVAALGAALPAYRGKLSQAVVARAASTAGAIALTPLPFASFLPLVVVQSAMVMSIARIYAYRMTLSRARELVATFGIGLLGAQPVLRADQVRGPSGLAGGSGRSRRHDRGDGPGGNRLVRAWRETLGGDAAASVAIDHRGADRTAWPARPAGARAAA